LSVTPVSPLDRYRQQVAAQAPFALVPEPQRTAWLDRCTLVRFNPGQYLLRPDELPESVFLVLQGQVRLLVNDPRDGKPITLEKRGPGQLLGWTSLLRAGACDWVSASEPVVAMALPAQGFVEAVQACEPFEAHFAHLPGAQEAHRVAVAAAALQPRRPAGWEEEIVTRVGQAWAYGLEPGQPFKPPAEAPLGLIWHLSSEGVPGWPVGTILSPGTELPARVGLRLAYRCIGLQGSSVLPAAEQVVSVQSLAVEAADQAPATSLQELGILEDDSLGDADRFPVVRGRGQQQEAMAVCEMVALQQRVPFRRDAISKVLEDQFRRDKTLSLELLAGLCELLGLNTQLAEADRRNLASVEAPALLMLEGVPVVLFQQAGGQVVLAHPHHGLQRLPVSQVQAQLGERFRFALPRRVGSTPTSRFGWNWFTPLLGKYKTALAIVFVASLLVWRSRCCCSKLSTRCSPRGISAASMCWVRRWW
jgi:hypothetical protein